MIPKIIHYIWFGGKPFPPKIQYCIESWKKYLPDYQFMLWNEDTFDVNSVEFTKQAYENKKWAFVSDYVRVHALNKYGGWYLDTDVEILKPLSPFEDKRMVLGTDESGALTALMGSEKEHPYWGLILDYYNNMSFVLPDGTLNMVVNNTYLQEILNSYGYKMKNEYQELREGIYVYPDDYFHVLTFISQEMHRTKNSVAIHWHTNLWVGSSSKAKRVLRERILAPIIGKKKAARLFNWLHELKK